MKIVNHFNYDPSSAIEVVEGPSFAVPDQTYSVRELFQRMARGLPLDDRINQLPMYFDDNPDIDNPDPTQRPDFDLTDYGNEMMQLETDILQRRQSSTAQDESANDLNDKDVSKADGDKSQA